MAICVAPAAWKQVRSALSAIATIEHYEASRLLILHTNGISRADLTKVLEDLRLEGLVEFVMPVLHDPRTGIRQIPTDEITIRLRPEAPQKGALSEMTRKEGVSVAGRGEFVPTEYILKVPHASGTRTLDVARRLEKRQDVEFASPNYITGIG